MNQTNQEFLSTYRNFFLFISENREFFDIRINESEDDSHLHFYAFQIQINENIVSFYPTYLKMEFFVIINFDELGKAYNNLDVDSDKKILQGRISKTAGFFEFFQREWHNIIKYLQEFNQTEDNYTEIAKLLNNFRGGIIGRDSFGI
jgi:hypothetical protein